MRDCIQGIPEEDQHINLSFRNLRAHLLIAAHRAAQHGIDLKPGFAVDQITGGAGGRKLVFFQQGFVALDPVEQHLFAVIVRHQRDMFAVRQCASCEFHNLYPLVNWLQITGST